MKPRGIRRGRRLRWTRKNALGLWTGAAVLVLLGGFGAALANSRPSVSGDRLRFDTFVNLASAGQIKTAVVLDQDSYVVGTYRTSPPAPVIPGLATAPGQLRTYNVPYLKAADSRAALLDLLVKAHVPTTISQQFTKSLLAPAETLIPALILVVILVYLILSYQQGRGVFARERGGRIRPGDDAPVTFADVAGQEVAVTELRELTEFLSDPARFAALGAVVPKGVLLYGPPGCGKTLLARAVAGEAGAAFYSLSGSDFVELFVGVGAARVRELFSQARDHAPAIVFIDELDSVGRRRQAGAGASSSREEQEQALNQILAELDGFSPLQGVVVIGATNRPDTLDPALLRPGRFDRAVGLERPDEKGRLAVLEVHAHNKVLDADVDLAGIATRANGLSGADLASVMNEAALLAARARRPSISGQELDQALQRVMEAPERQRRLSMVDRSFSRSASAGHRITFEDVAGMDEAIAELAEVRDYLADPDRYAAMDALAPRGFLLVGPPGVGKTMLARAVAGEANATFFSVAASEFVEVFVGEGAARVRDLFAEARMAAPSVVFLDEIDAIGARRGASADGHREREQTLNQILVELDGFQASSGVIVMAASNRPEILDEALVRPGRFDRRLVIGLPDRAARRAILGVHTKAKQLGGDVDLDSLAAMTAGFSGAELANVANEAALLATRQRASVIAMALMEVAVERVGLGVARSQRLSPQDKAMVACHEIGHALVGRALAGGHAPRKVSLVARGHALGATWSTDDVEHQLMSRSLLIDRMAALLGGRAAEQLVYGEPGSGAAGDLARVGAMARRMVCELGMSDALSPMGYGDGGPGTHPGGCSEATAATIDTEIARLVDEALRRATTVLGASRDLLDRARALLVERETLSAGDLDELAATMVVARPGRPSRPAGRVLRTMPS